MTNRLHCLPSLRTIKTTALHYCIKIQASIHRHLALESRITISRCPPNGYAPLPTLSMNTNIRPPLPSPYVIATLGVRVRLIDMACRLHSRSMVPFKVRKYHTIYLFLLRQYIEPSTDIGSKKPKMLTRVIHPGVGFRYSPTNLQANGNNE
jgi:hypothetical protein